MTTHKAPTHSHKRLNGKPAAGLSLACSLLLLLLQPSNAQGPWDLYNCPPSYSCDDGDPCTVDDTCCVIPVFINKTSAAASRTSILTTTARGGSSSSSSSSSSAVSTAASVVPKEVLICGSSVPSSAVFDSSAGGYVASASSDVSVQGCCWIVVCRGIPKACPPPPPCKQGQGTCGVDGECIYNNAPDDTPCPPETNLCGYEYLCRSGKCKPTGPPTTCPSDRPCQLLAAKACDPKTGECNFELAAPGTPCKPEGTADNLCKTGTCTAEGECIVGEKVCLGKQCQIGGCKPATGKCEYTPGPAGAHCSDGNACTANDTCSAAGTCNPGRPKVCKSPGPCQTGGRCNPTTGACQYDKRPNNTRCFSGTAAECNSGGTCENGACVGGKDETCTPGVCQTGGRCTIDGCTFTNKPDGTKCDPDDPTRICKKGECGPPPTPPICPNPPEQCEEPGTGVFNTTSQRCDYQAAVDNTKCSTGNKCLEGEVCVAGKCAGGSAVVCSNAEQGPCKGPGVCDPELGCSYPLLPNGTSCSVDGPCTVNQTCTDGECGGGVPLCPNKPCNAVTCQVERSSRKKKRARPAAAQCVYTPLNNGTSCDASGNLCAATPEGACNSGTCEPTAFKPCTPLANEPCKTISCNPATGNCTVSNVDDGKDCTTPGDLCAPGVCVQGSCNVTRITCLQPTNPCQAATCNSTTGKCELANKNDFTSCNTSPCITGQVCRGGQCTEGVLVCAPQDCKRAICVENFPRSGRALDQNLKRVRANISAAMGPAVAVQSAAHPRKAAKPAAFCYYVPDLQLNGANCSSKCLTANPGICEDGFCRGDGGCDTDLCAGEFCNEQTGLCQQLPLPDGTQCRPRASDSKCFNSTTTGVCSNKTCTNFPSIDCTRNVPQCQKGRCNKATGTCVLDPRPDTDGERCDRPCHASTFGRPTLCRNGVCSGGEPKRCPVKQCWKVAQCIERGPNAGKCVYSDPKDPGDFCSNLPTEDPPGSGCEPNHICDGEGTCIFTEGERRAQAAAVQARQAAVTPSRLSTVQQECDGNPCTTGDVCDLDTGACTAGRKTPDCIVVQ